jgi:hypothetical protein
MQSHCPMSASRLLNERRHRSFRTLDGTTIPPPWRGGKRLEKRLSSTFDWVQPIELLMPKTKSGNPQNPADSTVEIIVRRGALRRFDRLQKTTTDLPVKLSWDRRLHERRKAASGIEHEQRQEDRRRKPPFTWEAADFVVVDMSPPTDSDC